MEPIYIQQYYRMFLNFEKLEDFYNTNLKRVDISWMNPVKNLALSFFESCYHLKDYIKKEITDKKIVEDYINKSKYLKICADITNQSKHQSLNKRSRTWENKIQINTTSNIDLINNKASQTCFITFKWEKIDSLILAKNCKEEWDIFLKNIKN